MTQLPDHLARGLINARRFELDVKAARERGEETLLNGVEKDARDWTLSSSREAADWLIEHGDVEDE